MNQEQRLGFFCGMGAYFMWGFLPLYLSLFRHVAATDVLAHRVLWSVPTGLLFIAVGARWRDLYRVLKSRQALWLVLSSFLVGSNWLLFIWAVGQQRVMEASLGYFINPLVNVAIGALFLSERLRKLQWLAIAFAAIAVGLETIALGHVPWIALTLAGTFAAYGFIRRQLVVDTRVGFTIEVLFILPLALLWVGTAIMQGRSFSGNGGSDIWLLMLSGPFTAFPLLLFALAARRLRFSTIGIMQYLGPSLQFLVALSLGEALSTLRIATFVLIWMGVIVFSIDAFRHDRAQKAQLRTVLAVNPKTVPE